MTRLFQDVPRFLPILAQDHHQVSLKPCHMQKLKREINSFWIGINWRRLLPASPLWFRWLCNMQTPWRCWSWPMRMSRQNGLLLQPPISAIHLLYSKQNVLLVLNCWFIKYYKHNLSKHLLYDCSLVNCFELMVLLPKDCNPHGGLSFWDFRLTDGCIYKGNWPVVQAAADFIKANKTADCYDL